MGDRTARVGKWQGRGGHLRRSKVHQGPAGARTRHKELNSNGKLCVERAAVLLQHDRDVQRWSLSGQTANGLQCGAGDIRLHTNIDLQLLQRGVAACPLPERRGIKPIKVAAQDGQASQLGGRRQHLGAAPQHIQAGSQRPQAGSPVTGRQGHRQCLRICSKTSAAQAAALQAAQPCQSGRRLAALRLANNAQGRQLQAAAADGLTKCQTLPISDCFRFSAS